MSLKMPETSVTVISTVGEASARREVRIALFTDKTACSIAFLVEPGLAASSGKR